MVRLIEAMDIGLPLVKWASQAATATYELGYQMALGYKQLLDVERDWRDMKQIIGLRPVYHRLEGHIRADVILCWLTLLFIRIAETTSAARAHF
ncbi:hypothetical protein [Streptomyces sp. NBC_01207]|uniref:hypothetical protein n=1 Tax=Streptomyces sp. NBC_01207 TaxID=2903772 RepID=UPI002E0E852F